MIFLAYWRIISNLIKSFVDNFENLYQAFVHVSVEFRTIFHSQGPGSKYLFIVNRIFPALATQVMLSTTGHVHVALILPIQMRVRENSQ